MDKCQWCKVGYGINITAKGSRICNLCRGDVWALFDSFHLDWLFELILKFKRR